MHSITKDVYSHLLDNAVTATFKKPAPPHVRDLIEFEEDMIDLIHKNCYLVGELTFGGGNKNLVGGLLGRIFSRWGKMIKFFKHIVWKHAQKNL